GRLNNSNKTQPATLSNSSHISTKSQNTDAINIAISVKELESTQEINSPEVNTLIRGKWIGNMEYTSFDLQHNKKSTNSIVPIASNREAISARIANSLPEMRLQFRDTSSQVHALSITGDYSPHDEVHLTEISSEIDGGIIADENFGENQIQVAGIYKKFGSGNFFPLVDVHLSEISSNLNGGNTNNKRAIQPTKSMKNMYKGSSQVDQNMEKNVPIPATSIGHNMQPDAAYPGGTRILHEGTNSMQQMNLNQQQAIDQTTKKQALENISEEDKPMEEHEHDHQQRNEQTGQRYQTKGKKVIVNKHTSRTVDLAEQVDMQVQKEKEDQKDQNKNANQSGETNRLQQGNDRVSLAYQRNFPKISINFTRYDPNSHRNRNDIHHVNHNASQGSAKHPNTQQSGQVQNNDKQDIIPEPAPFTIGLPAVLLEEDDYNIKLAESCRHTLVGKHVYIDLDNEFDYVTIWTKQRMSIEGQLMRIQAWTPDFTPEEETPIVPIWVALPELPWHCYNKVLLTTILSPIGKVLYLDSPSSQKTRGSMARVKIQIDLTKERPPHV
ncbi:hypothetical protein H5410_046524, partial [Solanum commersonii]